MKKFSLFEYELWGNKEDGFDCNNVFSTGIIDTIEEKESWSEIQTKFGLRPDVVADNNSFSEGVIYLVNEDGQPVGELREVL